VLLEMAKTIFHHLTDTTVGDSPTMISGSSAMLEELDPIISSALAMQSGHEAVVDVTVVIISTPHSIVDAAHSVASGTETILSVAETIVFGHVQAFMNQ
jgi:hypothetical protein